MGLSGEADSSQLEFGSSLNNHNLVTLEEMHSHLRDGSSTNDQLNSGVGDGLNLLLHSVFFGGSVILQLRSLFDKDGTLRVGLGNFETLNHKSAQEA